MSEPRIDDVTATTDLWPESPQDDRQARDTLDRLLQGFQVVGFDWRYRYLNPAAARHGGHASPRALVGRTMMEAFPGIEETALFTRLRRCMQERCTDAFDNEFTYGDGTSRWFEIRVQPVPEGLCIYSGDIHERKTNEQRLRQQVADLEAQRDAERGLLARVLWSFFGRKS